MSPRSPPTSVNETSPLLPQQASHDESAPPGPPSFSRNDGQDQRPPPHYSAHDRRWLVPWLCGLLIFVVDFGDFLTATPANRLFELLLCRRYYLKHDPKLVGPGGDVAERYCKIDSVQSDLAMLKSWLVVLGGITEALVAIPYGRLAEIKGKRLVSCLSFVGITLSFIWLCIVSYFWDTFPPKAIWSSVVFRLIGGGSTVVSAMLLGMIADSVTAENRAVVFFYIRATVLLTELIAPPIGAFLMTKYSIWTPIFLAVPIVGSGFVFLMIIPQLPRVTDGKSTDRGPSSVEDGETEDHAPYEDNISIHIRAGLQSAVKKFFREAYETVRETGQVVFSNRIVAFAVISFTVSKFGRQIVDFLPLYASKRLGWSFAKTTFLISLRAFVNMILFTLILPSIIRYLAHVLHFRSAKTDLWIARGSVIPLVIGTVLMGFAPNGVALSISLAIYALGLGLPSAVQSFATGAVSPAHISILYVAIGMADTIGSLIAAPLLASSFSLGLKLGGGWIGLPFFISAVLFAMIATGVWTVLRVEGMAAGHRADDSATEEEEG